MIRSGFLRVLLAAAICSVSLPAGADTVPADQQERARVLRELMEQDRLPLPPAGEPANLPGAKLDAQVLRNREQLLLQRSADQQWRQLLGEQQAGRIRQEMTGIPSTAAPARAMGAERDQRMRDLSSRILQQDQQFRFDNQH